MASADTTLANLREIPLPPPVPYIPQTIGWVVVALLLLVILAYIGWRVYQRHLKNRYRRDALAELAAIERKVRANASSREGLCELPALVKRTALAFAPREEIAGLTGRAWLAFLDRTYPAAGFVDGPGRLLSQLAYETGAGIDTLREDDVNNLLVLIRKWIARHHARV